jgi:hypothetical protein
MKLQNKMFEQCADRRRNGHKAEKICPKRSYINLDNLLYIIADIHHGAIWSDSSATTYS